MSEARARLEARRVSFDYRSPILRDISFALKPGTITGIIGPNGSGKTTILRLLDGIVPPLSGEVILGGTQPLSGMKRKEIARHIAMVPQNGGVYHYQTVFQFAIQGRSPHLSLLGFESTRDEEIALEALEMTQLTRYLAPRSRKFREAKNSGSCWPEPLHSRRKFCFWTSSPQIWISTTRWNSCVWCSALLARGISRPSSFRTRSI